MVTIAALALTRVIAGPGTSAAAATAQPVANTVVIENFTFAPQTLTVTKGTRITVWNSDRVTHTFTATAGSFDTGDIPSGASKVVKLTTAGTFRVPVQHPSVDDRHGGRPIVRDDPCCSWVPPVSWSARTCTSTCTSGVATTVSASTACSGSTSAGRSR